MASYATAIAAGLVSVAAVAGEPVRYWRGQMCVELSAVPGSTRFAADEIEGFPIGFISHDWIVAATELALNGQRITPQRGDRVEHDGRMFEVLTEQDTRFRYCDAARTRIRVHTKQTGG